jgi:hypothetical protein
MESRAGSRPGAAATGWVAGGRARGTATGWGSRAGSRPGAVAEGGQGPQEGREDDAVGWRWWWNRLGDHTIRGGRRRRTGQRKNQTGAGCLRIGSEGGWGIEYYSIPRI